jgi:alkylation response protein AidB-like acyl-CoA dehydrogenase
LANPLTPDQEALRDAATRLYAKESSPERVREAESTGFDVRLWEGLVQLGATTMGVAEASGGAGATLRDLAIVAEQHGAHLGSVPLVETMVANRLLAAVGQPVADDAVIVFAPRPARNGQLALVPGAAAATVVVGLDDNRLVRVTVQANTARRSTTDLGATADVALEGAIELLAGAEAVALFEQAVDEWRALTAIAAAGLARAALDLGVQYAIDRHQFGVPIGSFQTIQHRLADLHCAVDGAALLAWSAVDALDDGHGAAAARAAQAHWFATDAAEQASAWSLHVHGGYGFMLEYDVQLQLRRAEAMRLALGDPRRELVRIAELLWNSDAAPRAIDFALDDESDAFRREVRAFLGEHLTPAIVDRAQETGTMHSWELHRALCERGYLAAGWPVEVGGLGRSPVDSTTLMQELYYAGAPVDGMGIASLVGATLVLRGTDEHRADVVPRILRGEVMCCLGYSEPDAGSDVAAVSTRAIRDGDMWVINGQKMFTTMAHEAHFVFLLCRTNLDAAKHKGLTMFLVPMATPGIEVTPVETLGGERTNITFYTDVRIDDSCRVGDVDAGWSVMSAALVYERNSANWGEPAALVDAVGAWASRGDAGDRPLDDPLVAEALGRHAAMLEVGRVLLYRAAELAATGTMTHVEGSMAKLWITEAFVAATRDLHALLGPAGLLRSADGAAPIGGLVEHAYRHAQVTTIYGGSSEVQRGIVAERGLGLPRTR